MNKSTNGKYDRVVLGPSSVKAVKRINRIKRINSDTGLKQQVSHILCLLLLNKEQIMKLQWPEKKKINLGSRKNISMIQEKKSVET